MCSEYLAFYEGMVGDEGQQAVVSLLLLGLVVLRDAFPILKISQCVFFASCICTVYCMGVIHRALLCIVTYDNNLGDNDMVDE